ncbi:MAG TPA: hypothetical protein VGE57_02450 [Solimonas sp.]
MFATLTYLALAIGVGLTAYYGQAWYELQDYSEADIEASTELNLRMDLQRRGPHLQPDADKLEQLRTQVRAEVEGEINRERETIQSRFAIGLIALVVGLGQLLSQRVMARNR